MMQPITLPRFSHTNITKLEGIMAIAIIACALVITSPIWLQWIPPLPEPEIEDTNDGKPVFKVVDGISDAAFSPADASVKMYDPGDVLSMPTANVEPFTFIDTCSESPDGEFTSTASVEIGKTVYVYITGTNYYTVGYFVEVPSLAAGTSGECESVTLKIYPNSGTIGNDISAMLVSGGSEIDSTSGTNNISFGSASYTLTLTVADGYAFGNNDYVDPETGYFYVGAFVVFDLDLSTARMTLTSDHLRFNAFTISSHTYWVLEVNQIINDDDITGDGDYDLKMTIDVSVGVASAALDIEFYTARRIDQVLQGSFGTSYEADDIDDLHIDTS